MKDKLEKLKSKLIKNRWKGIVTLLIICVLAFVFWYGGNAPGLRGWSVSAPQASTSEKITNSTASETTVPSAGLTTDVSTPSCTATSSETTPEPSQKSGASIPKASSGHPLSADEKLAKAEAENGGKSSASVEKGDAGHSESQGMVIDSKTGKDQYQTDPVPEGKPVPVEPQNATVTDKAETCTLSVRCDTILDNMDLLDEEKHELVPEDGVIFPATQVTFYEGESVFNVLQREMKKAKIQMEFKDTPMYNSAYIEGIDNLYEFDVGDLSGWMYKVNVWFPNYGCSRYQLKDGDIIEWVYTCSLGKDVGGYYSTGGS